MFTSLLLFLGLEKIVNSEEFAKRIKSTQAIVIFDTSALLTYKPREIEDILKGIGEIYVPDSVIAEIKDSRLRHIITQYVKAIPDFEEYKQIAKEYLEKTDKFQLANFLRPFLENPNLIAKSSSPYKLKKEINEKTFRLRRIMKEEGLDVVTAIQDPTSALIEVKKYLQHCRVSHADVDVLALALYNANQMRATEVAEKDIDIRQAIDLFKKDKPRIGQYLNYVEPYAA